MRSLGATWCPRALCWRPLYYPICLVLTVSLCLPPQWYMHGVCLTVRDLSAVPPGHPDPRQTDCTRVLTQPLTPHTRTRSAPPWAPHLHAPGPRHGSPGTATLEWEGTGTGEGHRVGGGQENPSKGRWEGWIPWSLFWNCPSSLLVRGRCPQFTCLIVLEPEGRMGGAYSITLQMARFFFIAAHRLLLFTLFLHQI